MALFLLSFLFSFQSHAAPPSLLPVVSATNFAVGRAWTWDYFDQTGTIYSTERYTVIEQRGSIVVIELASDYDGRQNLKPSTRIEVDLLKCLAAYKNPGQERKWSIKMFSLASGVWTEMDQPNTLAFEEKFNCNPHRYEKAGEPYLTIYSTIDSISVFQQKLWQRLGASWFAVSGPHAATAVRKEFNSDPHMAYWFQQRL